MVDRVISNNLTVLIEYFNFDNLSEASGDDLDLPLEYVIQN